ncbi:hypothetical protein NXS19_012573 [Fusarium pseudograminearum]|nr:hypothetical protein NXS19_012573 [Fusarium pseudograminearum]
MARAKPTARRRAPPSRVHLQVGTDDLIPAPLVERFVKIATSEKESSPQSPEPPTKRRKLDTSILVAKTKLTVTRQCTASSQISVSCKGVEKLMSVHLRDTRLSFSHPKAAQSTLSARPSISEDWK